MMIDSSFGGFLGWSKWRVGALIGSAFLHTLEQNVFAVFLDNSPASRSLHQGSKRRVRIAHNKVEIVLVQQGMPLRPTAVDRDVVVADLIAIVVVAAVDEDSLARVVAEDEIVRDLVGCEDAAVCQEIQMRLDHFDGDRLFGKAGREMEARSPRQSGNRQGYEHPGARQ